MSFVTEKYWGFFHINNIFWVRILWKEKKKRKYGGVMSEKKNLESKTCLLWNKYCILRSKRSNKCHLLVTFKEIKSRDINKEKGKTWNKLLLTKMDIMSIYYLETCEWNCMIWLKPLYPRCVFINENLSGLFKSVSTFMNYFHSSAH